jgi:hypothetical protein
MQVLSDSCYRLLYGYGRNIHLVSAIYSCPKCGDVLAHNQGVMKQLTRSIEPGFILFYKAALTQNAYYHIVNAVVEGELIFIRNMFIAG